MVAIREIPSEVNHSLSGASELNQVYHGTLQSLRKRLSLFVWQGFFEPLTPVSFSNDILSIAAPSEFHRDWVEDHYKAELAETASSLLARPIRISITYSAQSLKTHEETIKKIDPEQEEPATILPLRSYTSTEDSESKLNFDSTPLNPNYNFDTFIPGPSNQMAFAACTAVADQPGSQYSPLFLFGPVGIGKTHLIHGIGLTAKARQPSVRIVYMSAEQWVNAYIQAIRERRFDAFRKKFRSGCDILLIDDIQFLAGKDASQDEFFHTFNSLHQAHKQIVVTSDKYPHEIEGLEERLKTRLSWGLIADIRPPEIETRIAILHKKAETCRINLPNDVAQYLASQITSSVRELEGALLRLSAFLSVTKSEISLQAAKEYLSPVFRRSQNNQLTPDKITEQVAAYYDLKPSDIKGQSRQRQVSVARQVSMALCRSMLSLSLPEIGRFFGGRDHSTVLVSIRKIDEMRETDIGIQSLVSRLENTLLDRIS